MQGTRAVERAQARVDFRRGLRRETAAELVRLAAHLPAPDRLLIEALFRDGRTFPELAEMLAPREACGAEAMRRVRRQIRRRAHRLIERLQSEPYRRVAAQIDSWPAGQRAVAVACVLHGLTQREAADRLGLSLHTVRRHHQTVLGICQSAWKGARP